MVNVPHDPSKRYRFNPFLPRNPQMKLMDTWQSLFDQLETLDTLEKNDQAYVTTGLLSVFSFGNRQKCEEDFDADPEEAERLTNQFTTIFKKFLHSDPKEKTSRDAIAALFKIINILGPRLRATLPLFGEAYDFFEGEDRGSFYGRIIDLNTSDAQTTDSLSRKNDIAKYDGTTNVSDLTPLALGVIARGSNNPRIIEYFQKILRGNFQTPPLNTPKASAIRGLAQVSTDPALAQNALLQTIEGKFQMNHVSFRDAIYGGCTALGKDAFPVLEKLRGKNIGMYYEALARMQPDELRSANIGSIIHADLQKPNDLSEGSAASCLRILHLLGDDEIRGNERDILALCENKKLLLLNDDDRDDFYRFLDLIPQAEEKLAALANQPNAARPVLLGLSHLGGEHALEVLLKSSPRDLDAFVEENVRRPTPHGIPNLAAFMREVDEDRSESVWHSITFAYFKKQQPIPLEVLTQLFRLGRFEKCLPLFAEENLTSLTKGSGSENVLESALQNLAEEGEAAGSAQDILGLLSKTHPDVNALANRLVIEAEKNTAVTDAILTIMVTEPARFAKPLWTNILDGKVSGEFVARVLGEMGASAYEELLVSLTEIYRKEKRLPQLQERIARAVPILKAMGNVANLLLQSTLTSEDKDQKLLAGQILKKM